MLKTDTHHERATGGAGEAAAGVATPLRYCGMRYTTGHAGELAAASIIVDVPGVTARHVSDLLPSAPLPDKAIDAARATFAGIRDNFVAHSPLYARWRELIDREIELRRQVSEAEKLPGRHLAAARRLIADGEDGSTAEEAYRRSLTEIPVIRNRHEAVVGAVALARQAAADGLQRELEQMRSGMHAAARAEAEQLKADLERALAPIVDRLRRADALAGFLSADVNPRLGQSSCIEDYARL